MPNVHLVRHGDYDYRDRTPATDGQGLTERGRLQAAATATWLSNRDHEVRVVLGSDYTRAIQTADLIAAAIPSAERITDTTFRECEDVYFKEADQMQVSAQRAFDRLFGAQVYNRTSMVVFAHANLIRYLLARLENWSKRKWQSKSIPPCSISTVSINAEDSVTRKASSVAFVRHLPLALRDRF